MKLENQVVSLELAKKLKELGVKQESLFWYTNFYVGYKYEDMALPYLGLYKSLQLEYGEAYPTIIGERSEYDELKEEEKETYSAFTVAELGEMLHAPLRKSGMMNAYYPNCFITYFPKDQTEKRWVIGNAYPLRDASWEAYAPTEADARAKMLVYLLENKLI